MQWYERQGLAKFITLYVIALGYAFFVPGGGGSSGVGWRRERWWRVDLGLFLEKYVLYWKKYV